jgi:hypothetical protein
VGVPGKACQACQTRKQKCEFSSHGKAAAGAVVPATKGKAKATAKRKGKAKETEPAAAGGPSKRRRAPTLEGEKKKRPRRGENPGTSRSVIDDINREMEDAGVRFVEAAGVAMERLLEMAMLAGELRREMQGFRGREDEDE